MTTIQQPRKYGVARSFTAEPARIDPAALTIAHTLRSIAETLEEQAVGGYLIDPASFAVEVETIRAALEPPYAIRAQWSTAEPQGDR